MDAAEAYWVGYKIAFVLSFLGFYIYCIASYGFLLGVGLGWIPSLIAAALLSLAWPLLVILVVIVLMILMKK